MKTDADIVIVGAGAAGLWAAARCAEAGRSVLILEKTPRAGTKILASGGTRCNLTTTLGARAAAQLFGPEGARFLSPAFAALPPDAVRELFATIGVPTKTEPELEKVFPASDSAREVRNALRGWATSKGAVLQTDSEVTGLQPSDDGWLIHMADKTLTASVVMLCAGGQSYPKTGTTGDAYPWLRALGLKVVHPVPALVPLVSPAEWVRALTGVSADVEVSIGKYKRRRPLLFTHQGLSGPGPMDASVYVARASGTVNLNVDLMPDKSWEWVRDALMTAAHQPGAPSISSILPLQRRILQMVATQAKLRQLNPRARDLNKAERHRLVETVKRLAIPISGTVGFAKAEVTAGGLALAEVDRKSMQVKKHPGLYVFGELLDVTGPIGGLNFQSAFSTAEVAARHATA
ncbi:MAG: putative Rossmann fold flavoprotein [Myxococcota bacterium]|jgi:predicted Rossmann fold flavoprotein